MSKKQQPEQGGPDWQSQIHSPGGQGGAWQGNTPQWQPGTPPLPPAPQPQRNWFARHKVISGLGVAAIAVIVITTATSGSGSGDANAVGAQTSASAAPTSQAPASQAPSATKAAQKATKQAEHTKAPEKKSPGIGTPVRDGKFEFTVTKVVRGQASVGEDFMAQKAQGAYTLVYLTVKNIGDEARAFSDDNQKVMDSTGRQFEADSAADLSIQNNDNVLFSQINPGNSIQGVLAFDLPKGVKATSMELHDSMFSGGVKVSIG